MVKVDANPQDQEKTASKHLTDIRTPNTLYNQLKGGLAQYFGSSTRNQVGAVVYGILRTLQLNGEIDADFDFHPQALQELADARFTDMRNGKPVSTRSWKNRDLFFPAEKFASDEDTE